MEIRYDRRKRDGHHGMAARDCKPPVPQKQTRGENSSTSQVPIEDTEPKQPATTLRAPGPRVRIHGDSAGRSQTPADKHERRPTPPIEVATETKKTTKNGMSSRTERRRKQNGHANQASGRDHGRMSRSEQRFDNHEPW